MLLNKNSTKIKIIDFGLAQVIGPNSNVRAMMGTPEFVGLYLKQNQCISFDSNSCSNSVLSGLLKFQLHNYA